MSTVFRVEKNANYTVMSNIHLKDKHLSLRAAGLLSKILSLPPEWDYTVTGLAKITSDGVDSVSSAIRELEKFGYITRRQLRDEFGRMSRNEYRVYEDPKQNPDFSEETCEEKCEKNSESGKTDNIFLPSPQTGEPSREIPPTAPRTTATYNKLNTKELNTHSSITHPRAARGSEELTEGTEGRNEKEKYFSLISENIEYNCFSEESGVYELVELMSEVICSNRETVRVNGGELPLEQVKQRFLELKRTHIEHVLDTAEKNANEVRNRRAYLITLLYNSPATVPNSPPKTAPLSDLFDMNCSTITDEMIARKMWAKYL